MGSARGTLLGIDWAARGSEWVVTTAREVDGLVVIDRQRLRTLPPPLVMQTPQQTGGMLWADKPPALSGPEREAWDWLYGGASTTYRDDATWPAFPELPPYVADDVRRHLATPLTAATLRARIAAAHAEAPLPLPGGGR